MRCGPSIALLPILDVPVGPKRPLWLVGAILGPVTPPEMGSTTVIWVGYPAQLMIPDAPNALVVTTSGQHSHSSMFWVSFGLLAKGGVLCLDLKPYR